MHLIDRAGLARALGQAKDTRLVLADRLRAVLNKQGVVFVLRHGCDAVSFKTAVAICPSRPALALNEAFQAQHADNRLRVNR